MQAKTLPRDVTRCGPVMSRASVFTKLKTVNLPPPPPGRPVRKWTVRSMVFPAFVLSVSTFYVWRLWSSYRQDELRTAAAQLNDSETTVAAPETASDGVIEAPASGTPAVPVSNAKTATE